MSATVETIYLEDVKKKFRDLKSQADRTLRQVKDEELPLALNKKSNSISMLMKHISGNMIHLWTEPFASPEKKPPRNRDEEFVVKEEDTKDRLRERWERGWEIFLERLSGFSVEDLTRKMKHARREYTLLEGLNLQLVHYGEHIGQMIVLAKYFRGSEWEPVGFI